MIFPILFLIWSFPVVGETGQTYYVSPQGNDANDGKSVAKAWRTIGKVNQMNLKAGDALLFEGGKIFSGTLLLDENDGGTPDKPLRISSFGKEKAMIDAGDEGGIFVHNTQWISLRKLIVKGNGVSKNRKSGIEFLVDKPNTKLSNIEIVDCEAYGFHRYGILINGDKSDKTGFENVKITRCIASQNGDAGIGSLAYYPSMSHRNIHVSYCKAFQNKGDTTNTKSHTGNGIVLSGAEDVLIEWCEAYENGAYSRSLNGGPVGIWVWNCRKAIIQHSVSHHNHAGLYHDGGGFDIDGGASDCIIRNCNSHDNEGAGYLICEFGSPNKCTNNQVVNNVSRNDGLKNSYGGISISGASHEYQVDGCLIQNNKVYVTARNTVNGTPAAVFFNNVYFRNIKFENNYFELSKGTTLVRCDSLLTDNLAQFKGNRYKSAITTAPVLCKKCNEAQVAELRKKLTE
ncbi:right-handed parallel beta-helix repeat-containing protein [Runella sp.]|uniref:right-handed parallel beta-helix repeat-containing protein n=1 Tax=Runella sp. TaxID=1960881 RepID=UPI003D14813C